MSEFEGLEPSLLWAHFDGLRKVPRPSRHEHRARAFVEEWALLRGFRTERDAYGNLVVRVPASHGFEAAPAVVLQGHLDMVCEKSAEVEFDFFRDPIRVHLEDEWVRAAGTTLGADNGIGVAAALAAAEDPGVAHGPLEILLTVEEELGLRGALQLDGELVAGRSLINLDSEDTAFYIGCAGATDVVGTFHLGFAAEPDGGRAVELRVSGLRGGHSGLEILGDPASAIKLLATALAVVLRVAPETGLFLLQGGSSRNAIPREASATLWIGDESYSAFVAAVAGAEDEIRAAWKGVDDGIRIETRTLESEPELPLWRSADRDRIIRTLLACPHGVLAMNRSIPGLVETSNNLAVVETAGDNASISTLARSSSQLALTMTAQQISAIFELADAKVEIRNSYTGWQPRLESPLLLKASQVHERLFGRPPEVKAIHAGLECGVIGSRIPGMDAISIGPLIEGAHTPKERVHVGSVMAFYRLLAAILEEMARQLPPA